MDSFTYVCRKSFAIAMRTVVRLRFGNHKTSEDEVSNVPSREPSRTITTHIYRSKASRPSPVLINWHGSGFIIPMHGSDDEYCRLISSQTDYTVIDASYRLAPEHPFPAAPNDVEDVINWVLAQPEGFDVSRFALSGYSAGGNLALVASSHIFPKERFRHVAAIYPVTDLATYPNLKHPPPDRSGTPIPNWLAATFNHYYLSPSVDRKDPKASPSHMPVERLPASTMILTCACDSLCIEAEDLASRIAAVPGNTVVRSRMEKCDHGWDKLARKGSYQEKEKE